MFDPSGRTPQYIVNIMSQDMVVFKLTGFNVERGTCCERA
jgi:hypothetical protein